MDIDNKSVLFVDGVLPASLFFCDPHFLFTACLTLNPTVSGSIGSYPTVVMVIRTSGCYLLSVSGL